MIWLSRLEGHVEAEQWNEALALAVEQWRTFREPALADLVDAISRRCPNGPPLGHDEWLDRALVYDPASVPRLLSTITVAGNVGVYKVPPELAAQRPRIDRVFGEAWVDMWTRRITYACHWPVDPRVTWAVLDWIEHWTHSFPRNGYYNPHPWLADLEQGVAFIAAHVRELADVRARERLEALRDRPPGRSNGVRNAQRAIAAAGLAGIEAPWEMPLGGDRPARIATLVDHVGRITRKPIAQPRRYEPDGLWLAIREAPADDGPRQVLADALLERDDPRGKLLALQLQSHRRQAPLELARLVRKHWPEWLGEDTGMLLLRRRCVFERGMLATIVVGPGSVPAWRYDAALGHRELVAVRTVRPNKTRPEDYARLVASLPNVQTVALDSVAQAKAIAEYGPFEDVTTLELYCRNWPGNVVDDLEPLTGAVPALTTLQIYRPPTAQELARLRAMFPRLGRLVIELVFANQPLEPSSLEDVPGLRIEWRRRT